MVGTYLLFNFVRKFLWHPHKALIQILHHYVSSEQLIRTWLLSNCQAQPQITCMWTVQPEMSILGWEKTPAHYTQTCQVLTCSNPGSSSKVQLQLNCTQTCPVLTYSLGWAPKSNYNSTIYRLTQSWHTPWVGLLNPTRYTQTCPALTVHWVELQIPTH